MTPHDAESADALLSENAQLIAALAPFAAYARIALDQMRARDAPMRDGDIVLVLDNARITVGDLRTAIAAVRPQADALIARMADMSRWVGEQHTTIGYQDAQLTARTLRISELASALETARTELSILRELAADVARWRETSGDPRDLRYILETTDRYEAMKASDQ